MARLRRSLAALIAGAIAFARVPAADKAWIPPLDGQLEGEFTPLKLAGSPPLRWAVTFQTTEPRRRQGKFTVEGPGAALRGDVELDPFAEGTWRLTEARVELGQWLGAIAPFLSPELAKVALQGAMEATGEGTWRGGVLGGRATLTLRDGRLDDPAHKFGLEGVTLTARFEDLAGRRTAPAQVLAWRSGHYDTFAIGEGRVVFALQGDALHVQEAVVGVLGGELTLSSFVMSTQRSDVSVTAQVRGVDVTQLLFLLPPVLADARGRLDGRLALRRDDAGIQIGTGRLALRPGDTAELRLAPTPGLLSKSMPAAVLQHYPGLGKIEMGEMPLRADVLEVTFTPQGDDAGRTAWVHVAGGPVDPKLRAPIDLNINVRGPLESLVKFGTNSRLKFGARDK